MSSVDLIMDIETLGRVLTNLKVPQNKFSDYEWLLNNLKENNHPDKESALKLVRMIMIRLQ